MNRLRDKVALLTGGAGAIGAATATMMIQEGARVFVTDIADEAGEEIVAGLTRQGSAAEYLHLDVTDEGNWLSVLDQVQRRAGRLDVLANIAGVCVMSPISQTTSENWKWQLAVDLDGKFFGCKHALPMLAASGRGSIVNISSASGTHGMANLTAYSASKGAVRSFSKALALECGAAKNGIRVNSVVPGAIESPIWVKMVSGGVLPSSEKVDHSAIMNQFRSLSSGENPLGRAGVPDDIASAIVFLASDEASYINGQDLAVNGGSHLSA